MEPPPGTVPDANPVSPGARPALSGPQGGADSSDSPSAWRDELASRLSSYRARRKAPPPRYPSLRLPFERIEPASSTFSPAERVSTPAFEHSSNNALALDGMHQVPSPEPETNDQASQPSEQTQSRPERLATPAPSAKIIEFPRFSWAPPVPPPDQLAEPVMDRPRILEVPDFAPPPPALGGITIESVEVDEPEKRLGIDIPLGSAPLGLRIVAAIVDGIIISGAAAFFGFIFWKVSATRPPQIQMFGIAAAILLTFWAVYQYLLIVYSGHTPGLMLARLELTRFDGTPTKRSLRRWRVLASFLSAVSLGMGYVWVFLDEDSLCWHDRITRTYLAPSPAPGKGTARS